MSVKYTDIRRTDPSWSRKQTTLPETNSLHLNIAQTDRIHVRYIYIDHKHQPNVR